MVDCHEKKTKKTDDTHYKTKKEEEKKDETNQETTKLKSGNNRLNHVGAEYKLNIIDASNNEYKYTIRGEQILSRILKDTVNYNPNSDFEIEFENFKKVKADKKDIIFGDILRDPETFGIITYEANSNKISSYKYKSSDYSILNTFNNFTAYCNARNCLYFSGGENEQSNDLDKTSLKYNDFLYIDLSTLTEDKLNVNELPNLIEARTWHSMIFVPNKYIFIVGGSNTRTVELYDIDEKKLTKDSELNEIRCESTLCLVNNTYLYAFFGFVLHQEYNKNIERCNLLKEKRKWEYVNYQVKEGINLKLSFFGVTYFKENELLLIGGNDNDNDEKRFDYHYTIAQNEDEKDIITEYDSELKENSIVFREKLFHPIAENKAINIPTIIGDNIKIFIFESGKINVMKNQEQN